MRLKQCPHCGGAATLKQNYSSRRSNYFVFAACTVCGAQGKIYTSEEEPAAEEWANDPCLSAAAAWNMRYKEEEGDV